jgi:hypothetical protein
VCEGKARFFHQSGVCRRKLGYFSSALSGSTKINHIFCWLNLTDKKYFFSMALKKSTKIIRPTEVVFFLVVYHYNFFIKN